MKTWTCHIHGHSFVVTADDVDFARSLIVLELLRLKTPTAEVSRVNLIPLPTHHRHVRMIK